MQPQAWACLPHGMQVRKGPPTWLVVAPIISSASASHCSRLSWRRRQAHSSSPVVTILRLPMIWYVAGSTYLRTQHQQALENTLC